MLCRVYGAFMIQWLKNNYLTKNTRLIITYTLHIHFEDMLPAPLDEWFGEILIFEYATKCKKFIPRKSIWTFRLQNVASLFNQIMQLTISQLSLTTTMAETG